MENLFNQKLIISNNEFKSSELSSSIFQPTKKREREISRKTQQYRWSFLKDMAESFVIHV